MMKLVVLCCVFAAAAARAPFYFAPALPSSSPLGYNVPLQQSLYNYRGPLSLAPGQPANILAADGRPLDTLDVNLDRSAHFVATALENSPRTLTKRSVTRLAVAPGPIGFSAAIASGNIGIATPVAVSSTGVAATIATNPIGLSTPLTNLATRSLNIPSSISAGPISLATPIAASQLAVSSPITASQLAAVSSPLTTGSIAVSPIAAGSIGISASGTPFVRNF